MGALVAVAFSSQYNLFGNAGASHSVKPKELRMPTFDTCPPLSPSDEKQLEALAHIIAKAIADRVVADAVSTPFIRSSQCARLLGVTPQHLCGMRARGQGPPWSGEGKWVRYERQVVVEWIRNLPIGSGAGYADERLQPSEQPSSHSSFEIERKQP